MASGGNAAEPEADPVFDDEGRAESADPKENKKSRKFKPFEAVRKLFKGGKKRSKTKDDNQISVVSVKAKSTTALTTAGGQEEDDEDSDGGFKTHQSSKKLQGGKRSISEDSVFTPGDRTTTDSSLTALKTVTVSEENIPKNAFQNELFTKLKKRHSQYSDEDDGLPQSPVPPVTTADVIMGGLKPHPAKSSSRESEKSLISVDSSDNEMDDPFNARWSSPGKPRSRSSDQSPPPEKGVTMDFEAVKSTQALSNEAAKHKRSVKPNRKTNRQSRKKRETTAPIALASVNEESPTKLQMDDNVFTNEATSDTALLTVTTKRGSTEKPVVSMTTATEVKQSSSSSKSISEVKANETVAKAAQLPPKSPGPAKPSEKTLSVSSKVESKKDLPPQISSKPVLDYDKRMRSVSLKEESSTEKSTEMTQVLDKMKRRTLKETADLSNLKLDSEKLSESVKSKVSEQKTEILSSSDSKSELDKSKPSVQKSAEVTSSKSDQTKPAKKVEESKPVAKKAEEPKPKQAEEAKPSSLKIIEKPSEKQDKTVINTGGFKPTVTKENSDESNKEPDSKSESSSAKSQSVGFKVEPGNPAKEDYKTKRQGRSKTLPEQPQLPEDFSAKVQRTKSQRAESSPQNPQTSPQRQSAYTPTPVAKKIEPKRISIHETTPSLSEPDWLVAIKKKKADAETKGQGHEVKKDVMSTSAKEIFIKESEKPVDKMSKSFTASTTSSSSSDSSSKPVDKKESFTFKTSSVKISTSSESKSESTPKTYGSVKSPTKSVNVLPSSTITPKTAVTSAATSAATTSVSTSASKPFTSTTSSLSKSYTATTSSSKPEGIKSFGSSFKEPSKDSQKVSPTEEAKKVFTRGQSVKTVASSSESAVSPARTASMKAPSNVKSSVVKGSVQSTDSSSEKSQKDSSVPAWRSGVKSVNIEIIEKEPKQEVTLRKKPTPTPAPDSDTCRDTTSNRSSKVLDMVKNFQKLQVS